MPLYKHPNTGQHYENCCYGFEFFPLDHSRMIFPQVESSSEQPASVVHTFMNSYSEKAINIHLDGTSKLFTALNFLLCISLHIF